MKDEENYDEEAELASIDPRELEALKSGEYNFVDKLMKAAFSETGRIPSLDEIIARARRREEARKRGEPCDCENLFEFDFEELTEDSLDALSAAGEKSPDDLPPSPLDDDASSPRRPRKK